MLICDIAMSKRDLEGILELQSRNLEDSITKADAIQEGFVTVKHEMNLLEEMSASYPHIVAKSGDKIVGYALVMERKFQNRVEVLIPMFELINNCIWKGEKLRSASYFVMGQVCIDKEWRSQGIFYQLYDRLVLQMKTDFDYLITEVATRNKRSLKAHYNFGFELLKSYQAKGEDWELIIFDLNKKGLPKDSP